MIMKVMIVEGLDRLWHTSTAMALETISQRFFARNAKFGLDAAHRITQFVIDAIVRRVES